MSLNLDMAYPSAFRPQNNLLKQSNSAYYPTKTLIQPSQSFNSAIHQFETSCFKQPPIAHGSVPIPSLELTYKFFASFMDRSYYNPFKIQDDDYNTLNHTQNAESSIGITKQSKNIYKSIVPRSLHRESQVESPKRRTRDLWSPKEDAIVLHYVGVLGQKWSDIAAFLHNRTGKQVRGRYLNYLQPNIRLGGWTPEEDEQLIVLYHKHGKRWCKIASEMSGRTEALVKNRFYAHICHVLRRRDKIGKAKISEKYEETTTCLTKSTDSSKKEEDVLKEEVLSTPCKKEEANSYDGCEPNNYKYEWAASESYCQPQSYEDLSIKEEKIEYESI